MRADIMGQLVNSAAPFLFPCTIEYSLICAATLYVMWKNLNKLNTVCVVPDLSLSVVTDKMKKHQYSVDCARWVCCSGRVGHSWSMVVVVIEQMLYVY